jgi:hypothetical protein
MTNVTPAQAKKMADLMRRAADVCYRGSSSVPSRADIAAELDVAAEDLETIVQGLAGPELLSDESPSKTLERMRIARIERLQKYLKNTEALLADHGDRMPHCMVPEWEADVEALREEIARLEALAKLKPIYAG